MSVEEARAALKDLENVRRTARNRILAYFSAIPLMLWGLGWAFCHLNGCLYLDRGSGLFGIHPDVAAKMIFQIGVPITFIYVLLRVRFAHPVRSEGSWLVRFRAPLLFMVWCLFYECTSDLHSFDYGMQKNAYDSMYWMLLLIVYGFWLASGLFLSIGVLVCCWVLIGFYIWPLHYHLLMGAGVGSMLFGTGLYLMIKGRCAKSMVLDS